MAAAKSDQAYSVNADRRAQCFTLMLMCVASLFTGLVVRRCLDNSSLHNPFLLDSLPPQSSQLYDSLARADPQSSLQPDTPSAVVHYAWCGSQPFQFSHFVSLVSAFVTVQPDEIVFHYVDLPDQNAPVFSWFRSLRKHVAILSLHPLQSELACHDMLQRGPAAGGVVAGGGMLVSANVAMVSWSRGDFNEFAKDSLNHGDSDQASSRVVFFGTPTQARHASSSFSKVVGCATSEEFNRSPGTRQEKPCVVLGDIQPEDVWTGNDSLSAFIRMTVYNQSEQITAVADSKNPIPRICHVLYFPQTGKEEDLDLMMHASIKSMLAAGKMDHVYIHGGCRPAGVFMEELTRSGKVDFVRVEGVERWGRGLKQGAVLYGLKTLLDYGGILQNGKNVWLREFPPRLQGFGAVGSVDNSRGEGRLRLSMLAAKRHSPFLQTLLPILQGVCGQREACDMEGLAFSVYLQSPSLLKADSGLAEPLHCDSGDGCRDGGGEAMTRETVAREKLR